MGLLHNATLYARKRHRENTTLTSPLRELRSNFQNQRFRSIRVFSRVRRVSVAVPHRADSERNYEPACSFGQCPYMGKLVETA